MENVHTGELSVCKVLHNSKIAAKERDMLQAVRNPLFPEYRGYEESSDCQYIWMEYISGCNVKQYVRRRGKLTVGQAVTIIKELAQGLLDLHEQSYAMVYRDIKPENVMVQQDGKIRLVDVGCVCKVEQVQDFAGSPGYAAPEQFVVGASVGVESDVYALGNLFCFLLNGREGVGIPASSLCGSKKGTIPQSLGSLIQQLLQQERQNRIPDMRFLLQRLAVYEKKRGWQLLWEELRTMGKEKRSEYYYVKNVRR